MVGVGVGVGVGGIRSWPEFGTGRHDSQSKELKPSWDR